jgi:hypothetical protein
MKAGMPPWSSKVEQESANGSSLQQLVRAFVIGARVHSHRAPIPRTRLHGFLFVRQSDCHLFQSYFI